MEIQIIDDHQLFAAGLKHMLVSEFNNVNVACYCTPQEALDNHRDNVGLIILDFYIPGFNPLEYIAALQRTYPKAKLVVISSSISSTDRQECLSAGATAYFEKHLPPEIVLSHLENILSDDTKKSDGLSYKASQNDKYKLGSKKTEVLILLARGYSNKKIATRLGVSAETIKTHLSEIYQILHIVNRDEAREWACEHGFI